MIEFQIVVVENDAHYFLAIGKFTRRLFDFVALKNRADWRENNLWDKNNWKAAAASNMDTLNPLDILRKSMFACVKV